MTTMAFGLGKPSPGQKLLKYKCFQLPQRKETYEVLYGVLHNVSLFRGNNATANNSKYMAGLFVNKKKKKNSRVLNN